MPSHNNIKKTDHRFQTEKTELNASKTPSQTEIKDRDTTVKIFQIAKGIAKKEDAARNSRLSKARKANDIANLKAYILNGQGDALSKEQIQENPKEIDAILSKISGVIQPLLGKRESISNIFKISAKTKRKIKSTLDMESKKLKTASKELEEEERRHNELVKFLIEAIKDMFRNASQIVKSMSGRG